MVRLPAEYQEVEYLESNGSQNLNLPYGFLDTDEVELVCEVRTTINDRFMISTSTWNDNYNRFCMAGNYGGDFRVGFGDLPTGRSSSYYFNPAIPLDALKHTWLYKNRLFTMLDGDTQIASCDVSSVNFGGETSYLKLFYGYNKNTAGRIYSFKQIKQSGESLNLIPCYRKSDSEPGMYDTVSGTFFTNAGTGTFLVGNDVSWDTASLIERRRQILLNTPHLETISDTMVSFKTDVPAPVKDCKIYFEPVQDLHGYDKPYPAGGGKNLWGGLAMANDIASSTGVTVDTNNKTVSITTGGTEAVLTSGIEFKENTQYTFILDGTYFGHANLMFVYTDGTNDRRLGRYMDTGANVSAPGKTIQSIVKRSYSNTTIINYETSGLFEGVKAANDYTPYENICPITGWDGVTVTRCGKNLFDYYSRLSNHYLDTVTGEPVAQNGYYITPFIKVLANVPVHFPNSGSARRWFYDKNKIAKTYLKNSSGQTFTPTEDGYIRVTVSGTNSNASKYQIEYGSEATDYEPYSGTSITIPFPQTIYGGYVDLVKGEVVETDYLLTVDENTVPYNVRRNTGGRVVGYYNLPYAGIKDAFTYYSHGQCIKSTTATYNYQVAGCVANEPYNSDAVRAAISASSDITTVEQYPDWIANVAPLQIAYKLATHNTYPLTPQTIKTLKGINNIWSNANGNIELRFWKH